MVVRQSSEQLVRRNPRDLVAGAIKGRDPRSGALLFYVACIELIVVAVGEEQPPTGNRPPIGADFNTPMSRGRNIERKTLQAGARRLGNELIVEQLVKPGNAEVEALAMVQSAPKSSPVLVWVLAGVVAGDPLRRDEQIARLRRAVAAGDPGAELPFLDSAGRAGRLPAQR